MDIERVAHYWLTNAELKWSTAESLYQSKKYADSLFFYHLAIESLPKARVVRITHVHASHTHDLVELAKRAQTEMSDERCEELKTITTFNLKARYPDEKFEFYQRATEDYARLWIEKINSIKLWIQGYLK